MSIFAKAKKARENKKGFTLVELIVVLVILAILAAILVPALLGWIDKAKEKQAVLDCRSVYMAAQAKASEKYAADPAGTSASTAVSFGSADISEIKEMADVSNVSEFTFAVEGGTGHGQYTINKMTVTFNDGSSYELANDTWTKQESQSTPTP